MPTLQIYCEHVAQNAVHCNRTKAMKISTGESPSTVIQDTEWSIVDQEIRCPEHN